MAVMIHYNILYYFRKKMFDGIKTSWKRILLTSNDIAWTHDDSRVDNFESVENIMNREQRCVEGDGNQNVSWRQYYCYKLQ